MLTEREEAMSEEQEELLEESETEEQEETDEQPEEDGEEPTPAWLLDDDDEEQDDEGDEQEQVPLSALLRSKDKLSRANSEQKALQEENEKLKQQLASMQSGGKPPEAPKMPRRADYDSEEEHEDALEKYYVDLATHNATTKQASESQLQRAQAQIKRIDTKADEFYERADGLIKKHKLDTKVYAGAIENVQKAVEEVFPAMGARAFPTFLANLEEGDEATLFQIGRSAKRQAELVGMLRDDPSGMKAMRHIARLTERNRNATNKTSRAPAPGKPRKGDFTPKETAEERKLKAAYKKATDGQTRYNLRKQAKSAGFDVTKWS